MTEYKKYQLLKDIVLPGRIIPEGAIYEEYHTGRSYVNNREPYKPHFISPATIRQYPDWFKGIPPQPSSIDRIEVSTLVGKEKYADPRCTDFIYSFESNSIISPSNFHAIKQAIEQVLNESDTIDIDWSSKPVTEKYYKQSEVDTIREATWQAAKEKDVNNERWKGMMQTSDGLQCVYYDKYTNLQDYLQSLSKNKITQPKEEDKPVLFITEDGVEIRNGDHAFYVQDDNNWMVVSHSGITEKRPYPYFHTSESANKWVLENKPCLSLNEVKELANNNGAKVLCIPDEKISNYTKQKLNQQ